MPPLAVSSAAASRAAPRGAVIVFVVLFAAALTPIVWFSHPAMADYANHLARMFVLSRDGGPHEHPYYQVTWAFVPNLAMDLIVPRLGRLIGVETAARLFYLVSQILIVTGALALERAVKGRMQIAGFIAVMFLYSMPFAWGFENFEFGVGCALWGLAWAIHVQDRGWLVRLAVHTVIVAVLFAAHMFALGIYGLAAGLHELWRAWARRAPLQETAGRFAMLGIPSLVFFAAMIASAGTVGGTGTSWVLNQKIVWPFHILSGYSMPASAVCVVALGSFVFMLARRGYLKIEQSGAWLLAGFAAIYLAMPFKLFDTAYVDMRVIIGAVLILPAFVTVSFPTPSWSRAALALVAAITLVNLADVVRVWASYRPDFEAAEKSFALMPKGALMLVGHSTDGKEPPPDLWDYPMTNIPTLAVHFADAFVPSLFTDPGKQPVTPRAAWQRLDVPYGNILPAALLKYIADHGAPAGTPPFVRTWQIDFDYLYLVGPPAPNPMPERLEPVLTANRFALYRIKKP